jgi:hypothetical protein
MQSIQGRGTLGSLWLYMTTPVVLSLVYWFVTAPEFRFAHGLYWLLPISILAPIQVTPQLRRLGLRGTWGLFAVLNLPLLITLMVNHESRATIPAGGFEPMPTVPLVQRTTNSGLTIYTPADGYLCWDAPLPCTPYFNPGLHLLSSELKNGFAAGANESAAPRFQD